MGWSKEILPLSSMSTMSEKTKLKKVYLIAGGL
jgi:hypothetical protein